MTPPVLSVVTPIRTGPKLNDMPGMLRQLADKIESGDEPLSDYLMVLAPTEDHHSPYLACYGRNPHPHEAAGFLMHSANLILDMPD